jgi:hypothetical protein
MVASTCGSVCASGCPAASPGPGCGVQLGDGVGEGLGDGRPDQPPCHHAGQAVGAASGLGDFVGAGGDVDGCSTAATRAAFGDGCTGGCPAVALWWAGALCAPCADVVFAAWAPVFDPLAVDRSGDQVGLGGTGQSVDTTTEPATTLLTGACDEPPVKVRPRAVSDATPTTVAPAFAPSAHAVAFSRRAMFDLQRARDAGTRASHLDRWSVPQTVWGHA